MRAFSLGGEQSRTHNSRPQTSSAAVCCSAGSCLPTRDPPTSSRRVIPQGYYLPTAIESAFPFSSKEGGTPSEVKMTPCLRVVLAISAAGTIEPERQTECEGKSSGDLEEKIRESTRRGRVSARTNVAIPGKNGGGSAMEKQKDGPGRKEAPPGRQRGEKQTREKSNVRQKRLHGGCRR